MTLKNIINDICEYAVKNDLCNTSMGGLSLYDINFKQDNLYSIIFVAPSQNHNVTNNTIDYNFRLYYLDRLTRTNENNLDIFNASVLNLSKLINIIKEFNGVLKINNDYQIVNFADTQRLTDNVAGSYVDITVTVLNTNGICVSDAILPNINVIKIKYQNKDINITENGDYNVTYDNGYNALKEVNVNVNIDTDSYYNDGFNTGKIEGYNEGYGEGEVNGREEQKSLLESITITENGTFINENGYNEVNVDIDTQSYYENGYHNGYKEGADTGYNNGYNEGYNNGEVNGIEQGKEEQKSLLTSITITENGEYTNENGYNEVIVNVGGDVKPKVPNGISLEESTFTTIDMSRQDWSNVYDWSYMFNRCTNLTDIQNFPTDVEILASAYIFHECRILTSIPLLNTTNVTNMSNMFAYCNELLSIPQIDTSNVINMSSMFNSCTNLTSIPQIDTSNVINMSSMFHNCINLTSIPQIDTSNVINMLYMFGYCENLVTIPLLNTTNVTNMSNMFHNCINLTSVPELNTSNVTDMSYMFRDCLKLISIPELDISNVTNMTWMFGYCRNLEEVKFKGNPQYLTNVNNVNNMFLETGKNVDNPKMYYPREFETNYQKIINLLPNNWTAVPY